MSDLSRRTFLKGLSTAFGAATIPDLQKRILDNGSPILLKPTQVSNRFFVADNGSLALGEIWTPNKMKPVSWHQYFIDCGAKTRDQIAAYADGWDVDDLDEQIDDENWRSIFDIHYAPLSAGYHFLRRTNIGPKTLAKHPRNGRLDFFAGSNHPGSNDLWVECWDDLSVSLLQARLIELGHPIEVIMECAGSIHKDDPSAYGEYPADE
jgi:hypothetical protein